MRRIARFVIAGLALLALVPSGARAALKTETIAYRIGDKEFNGYLAYDDAIAGKRPGVLVVHEWWGLTPYTRKRAEMLAGLGLSVFYDDLLSDERERSFRLCAVALPRIGGVHALLVRRVEMHRHLLERGDVHHRQHDRGAGQRRRIDLRDQPRERDARGVFGAVTAGHECDDLAGLRAVHDGDRHGQRGVAPRRNRDLAVRHLTA